MNPDKFIEKFLEEINKTCFPVNGGGNKKIREQAFLKRRFHPNNYQPELKQHKEIARQIKKELNIDCQSAIGTTCQNVVRALVEQYGSEMKTDRVDVDCLVNGEKGQKGAWDKVYIWLHKHKFPRWRTDWIWQNWQEQARSNRDWISFQEYDSRRGMVVPTPPSNQQIEVDRPLVMQIEIDIEDSNRYLLLLNRGTDDQGSQTKYLVCPSQAFAPNREPVANLRYLPQSGAMRQNIDFDTTGQEEYIGIVVDRLPDCIWLIPTVQEPAPIWDETRIYELWQEINKQGNYQIFYQSFDVINN